MAKNALMILLAVIIIILGSIQMMNPGQTASQANAVSDLETFVGKATALLKEKGEAAFADFRNTSEEWVSGEKYVFVYDMSGKTLVLPLQREIEGTDRANVADQNGEKYVKTMVSILTMKDYGWNSYVYMKPGATATSEKLSYFRKVTSGGKSYIVGSGIYLN